jgi:hypothetical protein
MGIYICKDKNGNSGFSITKDGKKCWSYSKEDKESIKKAYDDALKQLRARHVTNRKRGIGGS